MAQTNLEGILAEVQTLTSARPLGRVVSVSPNGVFLDGVQRHASIGDRVELTTKERKIHGEIISIDTDRVFMLPTSAPEGISLGDRAVVTKPLEIFPDDSWIGRVLDANADPMDGRPLPRGQKGRKLYGSPPNPVSRRGMGARLDSGLNVMNTLLPLALGQRIGLFAGSGVGKTTLLGHLAKRVTADVVVLAMIGERGREVGDFVRETLGPSGMERTIIVATTSDQSPILRRQGAFTGMAIAEHFRDQGKNVLLLADSITRLAEAHREIATAAGEVPALRGHPPSLTPMLTSLSERAGPGAEDMGDITAVFSVLVAGSDMEEPVADILRGVLDGHIVLDRTIAEAGRYPAIDVVRSVSRCLPEVATKEENSWISQARHLLSTYERSANMIKAGLYTEGNDTTLDQAIRTREAFEQFLAEAQNEGITRSMDGLNGILRAARAYSLAASVPSPPGSKGPIKHESLKPIPRH